MDPCTVPTKFQSNETLYIGIATDMDMQIVIGRISNCSIGGQNPKQQRFGI